ncbi:FIST N-terminal domain-containing protein [Fulvivirgaceae bacterium BMA10]|uniref:FIST N-terminal domain-containing protein n=1 Tax=Splendidivirga corallicola TaxID=3051826 RepID=A0ABT8KHI9_9BACT|nr:FIST N-terminal domain-containing protein [Fulvivirgaceae bacterium BMA10]
MKTEQRKWTHAEGWIALSNDNILDKTDLVLVFGAREIVEKPQRFKEIKGFYPDADILLSSTSGEILDTFVYDESVVLTAISFDHTAIQIAEMNVSEAEDSFKAGHQLAGKLQRNKLAHVFVISDGQKVNGSELVKGLNEALPISVPITGGLAGDAANFQKTVVGINQVPTEGTIVAIGFYGDRLKVGHGSMGGWDPFGLERTITKSEHNVLYELDGESALDLYKTYLGDLAKELPGSALLFPLSIKLPDNESPVVRTILSIDENSKSMTFAGDVPEGCQVRFMKANFDRLICGAKEAANNSYKSINAFEPELAILISCVGRKLVLKHRVEEEVEGVREVLGNKTHITGFYSYGEISPFVPQTKCELHNQTLTITTLSEG